jgi:hypothetical protein
MTVGTQMRIEAKSKGHVVIDNSSHLFIQHEHIVGGNYSRFKGDFEAFGCTFEKCDFSRMKPRHVIFASGREPTRYLECTFDNCRFKKVSAGLVRFERCSFLDIDLNGFLGHAAEFVDCVFSGTIRASTFHGRVFAYEQATTRVINEFRGNDFSAAQLRDVGFVCGIDLSQQRLPVGDNYVYLPNAAAALAMLRRKYLQAPPSAHREAVFKILPFAEDEMRDGQTQLFLCKDSQVLLDPAIVSAIWDELRDINAKLTDSPK